MGEEDEIGPPPSKKESVSFSSKTKAETDDDELATCSSDAVKGSNKSGINVKSLLHHLMKNPEMIPKVMGIDEEDDVSNLKLTRSKSRQCKHPEEFPSPSFESDIAITRITRSFINVDYGQDDDDNDDDYRPEQAVDGSVEDENDEIGDDGDAVDDLEEELMKLKGLDEEGDESDVTEDLMKADDSMMVRTRSRVKNLDVDFLQSCSVEPENDVLLYSAVDDPDYMTFISTLKDSEVSKLDFDDDDPEYDFMADQIEDEAEKDELKMSRATEIPIREVEDLFEDIFAPHVAATKSSDSLKLSVAESKVSSFAEATTDQGVQKSGRMNFPKFDDHIIALIDTTEDVLEKTANSASLIGVSMDNPPHFTPFECTQLRAQLQKHVQLLTQFVVGCQFEPQLEKERDAYQEMINLLYELREKAANQRSLFNIPNLDACIVSCHDARYIDQTQAVTFAVEKAQIMRPQTMVVLSRSEAILFPELIPDTRMQSTSSYYRYFSNQEERLLALGVYEFAHVPHNSYQRPDGRNSLISRHYLPTKTPTQIKNHMKNFRSSSQDIFTFIARAEQGKVTLVFAPETCENIQSGPPITWNSNFWPTWLKNYHAKIYNVMNTSAHITGIQNFTEHAVTQLNVASEPLREVSFSNTQLIFNSSSNDQNVNNVPSTNTVIFVVQAPHTGLTLLPAPITLPTDTQFHKIFISSNVQSSSNDFNQNNNAKDLDCSHMPVVDMSPVEKQISCAVQSCSSGNRETGFHDENRKDFGVHLSQQSSTGFLTYDDQNDQQQNQHVPISKLLKELKMSGSDKGICTKISGLEANTSSQNSIGKCGSNSLIYVNAMDCRTNNSLRSIEKSFIAESEQLKLPAANSKSDFKDDKQSSSYFIDTVVSPPTLSSGSEADSDSLRIFTVSEIDVSGEDSRCVRDQCFKTENVAEVGGVTSARSFSLDAAVNSDKDGVIFAEDDSSATKSLSADTDDSSRLSSSNADDALDLLPGHSPKTPIENIEPTIAETPLITPRFQYPSGSSVDSDGFSNIGFEALYMGQMDWSREDFVPKTPRIFTSSNERSSSNEGSLNQPPTRKGKKNLFGTSTNELPKASGIGNCDFTIDANQGNLVTSEKEAGDVCLIQYPEFKAMNEGRKKDVEDDEECINQPCCSKEKDGDRSSEDEKCRSNVKRGKKRKRLDRLVTGLRGMLDYSHRQKQFKALSKVILGDFKQQMFMHQDKIRSVQALINTEKPSPAMFEKLYNILAPEHTLLLLLLSIIFPESALPSSFLCSPSRKAFLMAIEMIMNIEAYTFFGKTKYSARSIFRCIRQLGHHCDCTELENRLRELISNEDPLWFALSTNFPAAKCNSSFPISDFEFLDLEALDTSRLDYEDVDLSVALGPGCKRRQLGAHISNGRLFIERNGKLCEAVAYKRSDDKVQTLSAETLVNKALSSAEDDDTVLEKAEAVDLEAPLMKNVGIMKSGTDTLGDTICNEEEIDKDLLVSVSINADVNEENSVMPADSTSWTRFHDKTLLYSYNDCNSDFDSTIRMAAHRLKITDTSVLVKRLRYLLSWFK